MSPFLSLIPPAIVIILAIKTKKALEAMILGTFIGFVFVGGVNCMTLFSDSMLNQLLDPGLQWVIVFSLLIGGLMGFMDAAKASSAFTKFAIKYAKSEKKTFIMTLILAIIIYPDEYLRGLTLNTAMANVYKKNKMPKEVLGYSLSAVGVPLVCLMPVTTWAIYFGGLLEASGIAEAGGGIASYLKVIPFSFYAIISVVIYLLVSFGAAPKMGGIKKAYEEIKNGTYDFDSYNVSDDEDSKATLLDFLLPLIAIIVSSIIFDNNMMVGIFYGLFTAFGLYVLKGYVSVEEAMEAFWDGAKTMIVPMAIIAISYALAEVMHTLGFDQIVYMIKPFIIPQVLPLLAFIISAIMCYYTGEFWGMAAILLPAMLPLAIEFGINPLLYAGAIFSGTVFGSHTCVYGDYNALLSECIGVKQVDLAMTNTPYAIMTGALSCIGFLVAGFIL